MHLSALFQRRLGRQNGKEVEQNQRPNSKPSDQQDGIFKSTHHLNAPDPTFYSHEAISPSPMKTGEMSSGSPHSYTIPRNAHTWSHLPPPSSSSPWRRRNSNASNGSYSRMRRMSTSLASLFSPRNGIDSEEPELDPLLTEVFENPQDVAAFREALRDDAGKQEHAVSSSFWPHASSLGKLGLKGDSKKSEERSELQPDQQFEEGLPAEGDEKSSAPSERSTKTKVNNPRKVGRIAAASDFAPVYERTSKSTSKLDGTGREGLVYNLFRFPLLLCIWLIIALEFAAYVLIRQLVNLTEYFIAWRGHKGTLRAQLRKAETADEWREIALELDSYLGYEAWKCEDTSGLYDWILIKKVLNSLQAMREKDDAEGVMNVLELCLRNNFAGTENFRLYSETFFGTKYLIENYLSEVEECLAYVASTEKISPQLKRSFYRGAQKNMGRSALCLSGGGSFGYYHIGVVRALLDANLLPAIITGTSAGGLIAALACTRTDDELKRLLVPEMADRITACEEPFSVWGRRAWRTGARFSLTKWAEKAQFFTMGSMTFAEAYARTGKVLNISVIPSDRHSPVKLLNYHTAPNCIIWSSLLASAAVPGLLPPVCLMQKTRSGQAVPWNWGHRFKDGSLRVDIPLQDLHSLFNVNYPIVSQVNPHVHLFFFAPKGMPGRPVAHRKGKGWRGGFLLSASEHVLKLNLSMNFKIIRDLDLLPSLLGQDWSSVFLQRFSGAVTIWPKTRAWDWVRILSDPDRKELDRMMCVGQSVTFPKLHMIENRVRLERALDRCRKVNRKVLREAQKAELGASAVSGAGSGDGGVLTGGPFTQSDTDGTGDDFFSTKNQKESEQGDKSSNLRRMQRQLTNGFSRVGEGKSDGDLGATRHRDNTFTPDNLTPGELPRHIRVRSMGLDDEDGGRVDYLQQDRGETDKLFRRHMRRESARNQVDRQSTVQGGESVPFPSVSVDEPIGSHSKFYDRTSKSKSDDNEWRQRGSMRNDTPYDEGIEKQDFAGGMKLNERGHPIHDSESSSSSSGGE